MAKATKKALVASLLENYGQTYAREAGIPVEKNTPSPLFRLLCLAILQSARISSPSGSSSPLGTNGWRC